MKKTALMVLLLASSFASWGCVAQSERDNLQAIKRRCEEQVEDLKARLEEAQARIAALQAAAQGDAALTDQLAAAQAQNAELQRRLAELEDQIRRLGMGPVDPLVDAALQDLAAQFPDLMTYDSARGLVQLRSDLTFALGSIQVNERARASLAKLAQVVNMPAAQKYEVRVVGHTDSVPVTNPANKAKFEDNWGLSSFRAIAVMRVMRQAGVAENRFGVGGYADQRPAVSGSAGRRGVEANRRVEIYLVPLPTNIASVEAAPAPAVEVAPAPPTPTRVEEAPARFK